MIEGGEFIELGDDIDFRDAIERGRWDIDYFALTFLGIQAHPGQSRLWRTGLMRLPDGWRAAYLTICVSAGNRAGKTLGLAIYILHSVMYKMGFPPPMANSPKSLYSWLRAPYDWWHFGLQGEVSELVHLELARIFSSTHPAQKGRTCLLSATLGDEVASITLKERGDYPWIKLHPALGGGQIHFRSTSERALGSLGKEMNGVSWDECAFSSDFDFVVDEVLHTRRLGSGGQLILISTSTEGLTAFTDRWNKGDPEAPDRSPEAMSLRISTRDNIGYGLDAVTFNRLLIGMPEYLIPQNIDGYAIEAKSAFFGAQAVDLAFTTELPPDDMPQPKHRYSQGVDPALTYDSTWAVTLDFTDPAHVVGVRARRKTGRQTTLSVASLVAEGHRTYTTESSICYTSIDSTGFGGHAFADLLEGLHPLRKVEFGGTRSRKLKLLLNLKDAIEKGRLRLPRTGLWLLLRRQLLGYKLTDRKLQTDAVMALAVAWSEVQRQPAVEATDTTFEYFSERGTVQTGVPFGVQTHGGRRVASVGRLRID
jgi:hypothetical protein